MMMAIQLLIALLILGVIITVHEFGHYCVGRLLKLGIREFAIGFGPKLIKWHRKGIDYSIRAIPLGGFTAFIGEDAEDDDPRAFNNNPVWKRFLAILAGPVMNIVLAYLAAVAFFLVGVPYNAPVASTVEEKAPVAIYLQAGDIITQVNGETIEYSPNGTNRLTEIVSQMQPTDPLNLVVDRGGELITIESTLYNSDSGYRIGITLGVDKHYVGFAQSFTNAGTTAVSVIDQMLNFLRNLIFKGEGAGDTMGIVGTIGVMTEQISQGISDVIWLVLVISLNLAIINLLPLPALDGGRLLFLIVEAIRRKPINREREGLVHLIGFGLFIMLSLLLTYQDIMRMIRG